MSDPVTEQSTLPPGGDAPADVAAAKSENKPAGNGNPAETAGLSLEDQLTLALAERDAALAGVLRVQADFDNSRKRLQREWEQERQYSILPLVKDMLPGFDNLRRAMDAAKASSDVEKLTEGVQMVLKQFDEILAKFSVLPIETLGQPFDPNLHQAVQQIPSADQPPMTILTEYERGYRLKDRVIRPSVVVVSAPAN